MSLLYQNRFCSYIRTLFQLNNHQQTNERNYLSSISTMFAVATLVVSLFDYRWFHLYGGLCNSKYLGLNMFFTFGKLFVIRTPVPWDSSAPLNDIYQFKPNDSIELIGCVDTYTILLLRLMITLICLSIIFSTIGFLLDGLGTMKYGWKFIRRYGLCQILSLLICTIVISLCFYVSQLIYDIQEKNRLKIGKKVQVNFDIGYYLVVTSNCLLLISITFIFLKKYPTEEDEQFQRFIDELSRREQPLVIERSLPSFDMNEPPPDYHSDDYRLIL